MNPSEKGHEGAGGFANDVILINEKGHAIPIDAPEGMEIPDSRGWTSMCVVSDNSAILFGGLSGSDEAPTRLNDVWRLTLTV